MHLTFRNVNDAFRGLVEGFHIAERDLERAAWIRPRHGWGPVRRTTSRNGAVLVIDEPVTITYTHPTERVLFNAARDANPFFHLYEALWMLAGRNDVAPLAYYNSKIAQFSDDGKTFNGAYGYRWRRAECWNPDTDYPDRTFKDQLDILVKHLKADPTSRRAVLQMWSVEDDLLKIISETKLCPSCEGKGKQEKPTCYFAEGGDYGDLRSDVVKWQTCETCQGQGSLSNKGSKDVCCNLSVLFSLREGHVEHGEHDIQDVTYLDMTVLNRSNDLVWGLLGANYVHFTILQEYMAARLGAQVGRYHHATNNLHAYVEREDWKPEAWLADKSPELYRGPAGVKDGYNVWKPWVPVPLVRDPEAFERELPNFVRLHDGSGYYGHPVHHEEKVWDEPFLETVARPMLNTFHLHKLKAYDNALAWANRVKSDDWKIACTQWIERRAKK